MNENKIKIFRGIFVALSLLVLNFFVYSMNKMSCSSNCLEFRNEVITISDIKDENSFKDIVPTEISDLREILKPIELKENTPRQYVETKQYEVIAKIKSYFKYDNGCYKLVLYQPDDTISSISAIILNPNCINNKDGVLYDKIKETYNNFLVFTKAPFKDKKVYYKITGAAFFSNEIPYKKYGLSNGLQIAPIFNFKKF